MRSQEGLPRPVLRTWGGLPVEWSYLSDWVESAASRPLGHVALLEKYVVDSGDTVPALQVQLVTLPARLLLVEVKTPAHSRWMRVQRPGVDQTLVEVTVDDDWHPFVRRAEMLTRAQALDAVAWLVAEGEGVLTLPLFTAQVAFDLYTDVAEGRRDGPDQPRRPR